MERCDPGRLWAAWDPANKGTAKEALDLLVKDWKTVFKEDGKID